MALWKHMLARKNRIRDLTQLREVFDSFQKLIEYNNRALEYIADIGDKLSGDYLFDRQYIRTVTEKLAETVYRIVQLLNVISRNRHVDLFRVVEDIRKAVNDELEGKVVAGSRHWVVPLEQADRRIADQVGLKMATLGELKTRLGAPVPDGFIISAFACERFFEENRLLDRLNALVSEASSSTEEKRHRELFDEACKAIRSAAIPKILKREVEKILARWERHRPTPLRLSLRSSALDEDGRFSFAGQFASCMNVSPQRFFEAYKEVVASLFSPRVWHYRRAHQISGRPLQMAVGCMPMIPAQTSGVLYTRHPTRPGDPVMLVSAAPGFGKTVVEGSGAVDQYEISKDPSQRVLSRRIARKTAMYAAPADQEGLERRSVAEDKQSEASLSDAAALDLAKWGSQIEVYFRHYQDIEWVLDDEGRLFILQSRPLSITLQDKTRRSDLAESLKRYRILLREQGMIACRGIGAGPVYILPPGEIPETIPNGCVLVARRCSSRLAPLLSRASALLADIGSPAEHLATVAREYRVPAIVDVGNAVSTLVPGMVVTVDAEENLVYEGYVRELLEYGMTSEKDYEDIDEFRLLRRISGKISTLTLTDPNARDFRIESCKSYHDIIRFAHEMAVREIAGNLNFHDVKNVQLYKLKLPLPLNLSVIDIGGGVEFAGAKVEILPEHVRSVPLLFLLEGLLERGVWRTEAVDLDFKSLMSSFTRSPSMTDPTGSALRPNLAIVTECYLNLHLHLGYHFNLIDCCVCENRLDNYVYFRFLGGVTDISRRSRRAQLLSEILKHFDFLVETKGDLVIGRLRILDFPIIKERMHMLGRLIGFTRQLDVALRSEEDTAFYRDRFLESQVKT
ncbi:MAG: pyruvate, water dikinase [Desulfobacteraceae bacterium]|nr:MAG: pyruvate, water dikinase [Desulfobacteraceae bacterium]